jgi:Uma2 family endonuclease
MTLEEFNTLPEGPPNYEFENEELIPMPSPTADHQDVLSEMNTTLRQFVRQQQSGRVFLEVDVYLPDGRVYIPDLSYLATDHLSRFSPIDRKIHGAPDLVIEILSTDENRDRIEKFRIYFANGVAWYWIIDPLTLAIEEYEATPQGYLRVASVEAGEDFQPKLFPGLTINLAQMLGIEAEAESEPPAQA